MIIHIVQPGETIFTIAESYGFPVERLILDNGLTNYNNLVVGQSIAIAYPEQTYTVHEGDTLQNIADINGITINELLRNNPFMLDRDYVYPGEVLVISYADKISSVTTNGYSTTYINKNTLRKTLLFLTYLSVFGYQTLENAQIESVNDLDIIQEAKKHGVAPIMLLSTLTEQGSADAETEYRILYNPDLTDIHIENILYILKTKGYYGLNISFQFITSRNQQIYENYLIKLTHRLHSEGYQVFVTIAPNIVYNVNEITFERIDYTGIAREADSINIMQYNWGYSFGPPAPVSSDFMLREFLNYAITMIPPKKIVIGLPIIGYDWELPYIVGVSKANSLSLDSVINLALNYDAIIQFDEISKTPYFEYSVDKSGVLIQHIVWFIDVRSIDALVKLVPEYGLSGSGVWNIMNYYSQLWLVINTQYEIISISNVI
ncbi:LysM peptidoglycan-binding domain-containing protein [Anaerocolumna xylanovorans]|uniref:Spore germination protein n=1 Tax=Anaerocolumna xylanovorans DSM 12503 TaxID=1121345 RepID=A0A1M7YGN1_9FIRM|nr:LysM peptidoglycan-binding domain-containing protein [Anaerocolumna xylanovorans]SHO51746.1 spore germination protein [Anaerocolumna xylanovorans DSM 12503]